MRWPRRRWGFTLTVQIPGHPSFSETPPVRFWTRAGAEDEAWETRSHVHIKGAPDAQVTHKVTRMDPLPNVYADKYWQGDRYVGPEI
jgi:hypothetical protein